MKKKPKQSAEDQRFSDLAGELGDVTPLTDKPRAKRATRPKRPTKQRSAKAKVTFERPQPAQPLLGHRSDVEADVLNRLARGEPAPTSSVDLHRLNRNSAERALQNAIETAAHTEVRVLRVIHGRGARSPGGISVLREALPEWLMGPKLAGYVLAFAPETHRAGSSGATHVLIATRR
jgi:DNA-nicking Smr family endonuclease